MVGFRHLDEMANFLEVVPELKIIISEDVQQRLKHVSQKYESIEKDSLVGRQILQKLFTQVSTALILLIIMQCKSMFSILHYSTLTLM